VSLNQPFRFEFSVSISYRRAVNAEHGCQLAAGWNAVARAQIARVNESPQLIAKLDVQRNVLCGGDGVAALSLTFGQFYQILAWCKSQFVFPARPYGRPKTSRSTRRLTSRR